MVFGFLKRGPQGGVEHKASAVGRVVAGGHRGVWRGARAMRCL